MGSGGGGSSAPTEQTIYNTSLPEYVEPYFKDILGRASAESKSQYTPFPGRRVAYFSPDEMIAQGMSRGYASTAPGGYNVGIGRAAMTSGFQGLPYSNFRLQNYMDPYQQNVTDIQKREAIRRSQQMGSNIMGQAAQAGGLGGYREAIMQAERQRNLAQQLDDIQGRGSQQAFMNAQQQLQRDRDERARAAQIGLSGAQALPGLLAARSQDAENRIGMLSRLGQQARAMRQAGLDIGYQNFQAQRQYPRTSLGFYSNILRGVPVQPEQTISTYQQQPGLFQSLVGAGLGGLGLYKGLTG